ncbi:MAG: aspartate carbamoyltransferase [Chloroflexi bacterium]|nr:aspartate carbamoyltransferase [Chloroflexota bacterium]
MTNEREYSSDLEGTSFSNEQSDLVWDHEDVLDLDDFTVQEIETVIALAEQMREVLDRRIARAPALRGFTVINLFFEPSTRTRASFELAGKVLGADVISVSADNSSVVKGESLIDTVKTLSAMRADAIVMRHSMSGAPYLASTYTDAAIINAGDGSHAHPTQALLDIYTLKQRLGSLRGKKIVMVGDISHSRVARSGIWGFSAMGAEVVLCGPPTLLPAGLNDNVHVSRKSSNLPSVQVETDIDVALDNADVVMALRLQKERQQGGLLPSLREYSKLYQVTQERLSRAKQSHVLMHPGPKNEGIEIAGNVASGSNSTIEEQVTNGVAVRMALLYLLAGKGQVGAN